ncbi:hypothetical protein D3OALGA1CA_1653 [Olavius algarvensis associated proteobacterium Delta 3]|nr:hypothetical protein D3OALGA1CA_1653 [Olavius algarvensis associated proteobacterium Delta 3]
MKIMLTFQLHENKLHDTLTMFSHMTTEQEQALMGEKLKLLGRWHNLVSGEGFALFECDSAEAVSAYALNWNKYMDLEAAVVVDDDEAKAIGNAMSSE